MPEDTFVPILDELNPTRRTHGGRRRGAGAPKGNLNAAKDGRYSKGLYRAGLILASVPELQAMMRYLRSEDSPGAREELKRIFTAASYAVRQDPELAEEVRKVVYSHLAGAQKRFPLKSVLIDCLYKRDAEDWQ